MISLAYKIQQYPQHCPLDEKEIGQEKLWGADHVDDEKMVFDRSPMKELTEEWIWRAPLYGFIGIIFLIFTHSPEDGESTLETICFMALFAIATSLICYIYWRWNPAKKVFVLDRMQGRVKFPVGLLTKGGSYAFGELDAYIGKVKHGGEYLAISPPGSHWTRLFRKSIHLHTEPCTPAEAWSFYVWYMDRNRPLPPGALFDRYRQQDFDRRQAEGFPHPLYPGTIATPEWSSGANGVAHAAVKSKLPPEDQAIYQTNPENRKKWPR